MNYYQIYFRIVCMMSFALSIPMLGLSQNSKQSGNIRACGTWLFDARPEQLNNLIISNNHIIETNPTTTSVNSLALSGSNSILEMNEMQVINLGSPTNAPICISSLSHLSNDGTPGGNNYMINPTTAYCGNTYTNPISIAPSVGTTLKVTATYNVVTTGAIKICDGRAQCAAGWFVNIELFDIEGNSYGTKSIPHICGGVSVVFDVPFTTLRRTRYRVCHRIFWTRCAFPFATTINNFFSIDVSASGATF